MWIYFFSGENCKYCIEPKSKLLELKHPKSPVVLKDISDPLFNQFGLSKIPAMVIVESEGDIRKYQGCKMVCEELDKLKIVDNLKLTIEF
jgi:hypothetical protein